MPLSIQAMADCSFETNKKTAEQLDDENFRRQNVTFAEKAERRREEFGADVFILVRRKGKLMVYTSRNSLDDRQWPLRGREITNYYPKTIKTPETLRNLRRRQKPRRTVKEIRLERNKNALDTAPKLASSKR
jgi:hypothetical protein